jgi:hypothetical protein
MAVAGNSRIQKYTPPQKTKAQIEAEERAAVAAAKAAQIKRDQAASAAAFKASGLSAAGFISMTDAKARATAPVSTTNNKASSGPVSPAPAPTAFAPAPVASTPSVVVPSPTPPAPAEQNTQPVIQPIKSAPIDTVQFIDETLSDEFIVDLLFEDVGGQELLTIARGDTVNGQSVIYQPFKNLGILQEIYNPTSLLRLQETSDKFFSNFIINLRDRIPNVGNGSDGANYYIDPDTGDVVIEFVSLKPDEQVDIQLASAGIIDEAGI